VQPGPRPSVTGVRLIGRARECAAVDRLIEATRGGRSASLMVTGEPGIGKSSLLAYGVEAAGASTMVLTAKCIRTEGDIPFAALAQVVGRFAWHAMDLPRPQRIALEAAFAITDATLSGDRFAVGAGVLNVLAAAALERPILVVVDDMQWIDDPSASAIIFAARRLEHDRVGFLLAYRDSDVAELPDLPQLRLEGLDAVATAQLLATRNLKLTTRQVAGLVRLSGGNPLALVDLPDLMGGERLVELDFDSGPLPLGTVLETAYAERIDRLPDRARRALLVAALIHGSDPQALRTALAAAEVDMSALVAAEDARLILVDVSGVIFRHPLIRSATVQRAASSDRRRAHGWIAAALEADRSVEGRARRAWHLAATSYGPDEDIATMLEESAQHAVNMSGYASASSAFERAAQLSASDDRRAGRLLLAATAAFSGGNTKRAADLLGIARSIDAADDETQVEIEALSGRVEISNGDLRLAFQRLVSQARLHKESQPELALKLLAMAFTATNWAGMGEKSLAVAQEAVQIGAVVRGPYASYSRCALSMIRTLLGDADDGTTLDEAVAGFPPENLPPQMLPLLADIAFTYTIQDRFEDATALHETMIRLAKERAAAGFMTWPVGGRGLVDFRMGRWREAEAAGLEAERLAIDAGLENRVANTRQQLAWIAAARGRSDVCRRYASQVLQYAHRTGAVSLGLLTHSLLGLLELGEGRPDDAVVTLEEARRLATVTGFQDAGTFPWTPELVEAYVQCGRRAEAEPLVDMLTEQARRSGRPIVGAFALRCRGLVRPDDSFDADFLGALDLHRQTNRPFETARTELRFGQRLRRRKSKSDARTHLRAAWETFSAIGADCWTASTHNELQATGVHLPARALTGADRLTPQELQIALAACEGATNRQVAERLFVSAKTVEYHLSHIYRKLGITSRSQLGAALAHAAQ
jgi:DNA-binding CsgD family transcriptional regulator